MFLTDQEILHCCRYLIVCMSYERGYRPSSIAIKFNCHLIEPGEVNAFLYLNKQKKIISPFCFGRNEEQYSVCKSGSLYIKI